MSDKEISMVNPANFRVPEDVRVKSAEEMRKRAIARAENDYKRRLQTIAANPYIPAQNSLVNLDKKKEATSQQLSRVNQMRLEGLTFAEIGKRIGLSTDRARQLFLASERAKATPQELSVRAQNCLANFFEASPEDALVIARERGLDCRKLLKVPNTGQVTIAEIMRWAMKNGISVD